MDLPGSRAGRRFSGPGRGILHLQPGDKVVFSYLESGAVRLEPAKRPRAAKRRSRFAALRGRAVKGVRTGELMRLLRDALFLAGRAHLLYRGRGGTRHGVLADFFVGAHAAVRRWPILTRDPGRYRACFPTVELVSPQ